MRLFVFIGFLCLSLISTLSNPAHALTPDEEAMVYIMLSQTNEVSIHQMRGATGNQIFVHSDGHREAVYDSSGNLVQDGINDASYNYAHPKLDPFGHFEKDIEPWIKWGTSKTDPTTPKERIYAYMGDIERGIASARKVWATSGNQLYLDDKSGAKIPDTWRTVMDEDEVNNIFKLINGDSKLTDDALIASLMALNEALGKIY